MKKIPLKILALVIFLAGLGILAFVLVPILAYDLANATKFTATISPIPGGGSPTNLDYTKASNWFAGGKEKEYQTGGIIYYRLSIPKLNIEGATVAIGGEDLAESLIQYPGTALPGKPGNAVIFGHSILPQFYNPDNYLSIFSRLPSLEKGNLVYAEYDGVIYKYQIEEMFEVSPDDLQVLEQNNSDSFLTLVTCTPPGHPLRPKRLIVRARVIPLKNTLELNSDLAGKNY